MRHEHLAEAARDREGRKVDAEYERARAALWSEFETACDRAGAVGDALTPAEILSFFRRRDALQAKRIAGHVNALRAALRPFAVTPQARALVNARIAEAKALMEGEARAALGKWTTDAVEAELQRQDAASDEFDAWLTEALGATD